MRTARLADMVRGWFIGDFEPSLLRTTDVEVAVKEYSNGDRDPWHYHKVATEVTLIVSGRVKFNDRVFDKGDIVVLEPGEGTDFEALADAVTVVVKIPGAPNDKYSS